MASLAVCWTGFLLSGSKLARGPLQLTRQARLWPSSSQMLPVRFLARSHLSLLHVHRVTETPQTLVSTPDPCHLCDVPVPCRHPLVGGWETWCQRTEQGWVM